MDNNNLSALDYQSGSFFKLVTLQNSLEAFLNNVQLLNIISHIIALGSY